jgi:hypothetical protein
MWNYKTFSLFYLLGICLWGLGYLAILPPFEGFSESSHYSSIREIAGTGKLPVYGKSRMDTIVSDYQGNAPSPYGTLNPPFDRNMTYASFFAHPDLADSYIVSYRAKPIAHPYAPGNNVSWEALHAPLYYLVLAPFEKISEALPLIPQMLLLRLVSFTIALAGVALALYTQRHSPEAMSGFAAYPVVFPMFFPEFVRLGNDSLCVLICAVLAWLVNHYSHNRKNTNFYLALGTASGIGLLTKAFFIPITAACAAWLVISDIRLNPRQIPRAIENTGILFFAAFVTGGIWYLYKLAHHIPVIDFDGPQTLAEQGGLIAGLRRNFSVSALLQGFGVNFMTWIWAGTGSLARMSAMLYIPMALLVGMILGAFIWKLREKPLHDPAWLTVALFACFGLGFLRHMLISLAITGTGNTPAWYLHILLPFAAPCVGIGLTALMRHRLGNIITKILLAYAGLFQLAAIWAQVSLFSGCATKGADKYYVFSDSSFCLDKAGRIWGNLSVLGWPQLALAGFSGGLICLCMVCFMHRPQITTHMKVEV